MNVAGRQGKIELREERTFKSIHFAHRVDKMLPKKTKQHDIVGAA